MIYQSLPIWNQLLLIFNPVFPKTLSVLTFSSFSVSTFRALCLRLEFGWIVSYIYIFHDYYLPPYNLYKYNCTGKRWWPHFEVIYLVSGCLSCRREVHNALEKNRLVIPIIINIDNVSFDFLVGVFFLRFSLALLTVSLHLDYTKFYYTITLMMQWNLVYL